jgi:hypothetical protein
MEPVGPGFDTVVHPVAVRHGASVSVGGWDRLALLAIVDAGSASTVQINARSMMAASNLPYVPLLFIFLASCSDNESAKSDNHNA